MMKRCAIAVVTILCVGCTNAADTPEFQITTKRDNDKIEVQIENGKVLVSIQSPFGISQATIERLDEEWPDTVVLRLHLKGLENFKVTNRTITLEAAVSSQDVRIWKDGNENSPLDAESPYWLEIRMVGKDETIPPNDGYFEIELPKVFFEENPESITVNWIDFYRN